jgi:tetratricopeptide (TPR) repeat protein
VSASTASLRRAVAGLIGLAAAEEQRLAVAADLAEVGGPRCWAALPVVAHNTAFRRQQVTRLRAIRASRTPPEFAEVDHESGELYADLSAQPADAVAAESWMSAGDLMAELGLARDEDLLDPSRNPWLRGRQLWLQIVVRGFWHPAGHLGAYYAGREHHDEAVALAAHAVAAADYLGAPDQARGMASYNLACAQAAAGLLDAAQAALTAAVALNPDLHANAARDGDLALLRASGRVGVPSRGDGDR